MIRALVVAALIAASSGPATAEPEREQRIVVTTPFMAYSVSQDPVVRNTAAASVELRYQRRLGPRLRPDAGLALLAFPDQVGELRLGAALHPFGDGGAGAYVRPALQLLLSVDGFDVAPGVELGVAPGWHRVTVLAAAAANQYLLGPRLAIEIRLGVGVEL